MILKLLYSCEKSIGAGGGGMGFGASRPTAADDPLRVGPPVGPDPLRVGPPVGPDPLDINDPLRIGPPRRPGQRPPVGDPDPL